jgi:hypothetical protein
MKPASERATGRRDDGGAPLRGGTTPSHSPLPARAGQSLGGRNDHGLAGARVPGRGLAGRNGCGSESAPSSSLLPDAAQIARLWMLVAGAVGLVLFGTLMAPSREALMTALLLLLIPLAVLRRDAIVPALLTVLPFYTLVRRLFLLRDPTVLNLDPLILLPDLMVMLAGLHLLARPFIARRPVRRSPALGSHGPPTADRRRPGRGGNRSAGWQSVRPIDHRSRRSAVGGQRSWSPARQVDWAVVTMIAITVLGFIVGTRNGLIPALNGARMFGLYILVYFLARVTIRRFRQVGEILLITVFTGLVTGLYGIYQTLIGLPGYDRIYFENTPARQHVVGGFVRAFSTFQFTGHFSVFMLITFLFALTLFQQRTGRTLRLICLLTMLTAVVAIATTFVRSTWVGLVSGLAAYALLQGVRRPLLRWAVVLALIPAIQLGASLLDRQGASELPATSDNATQVLQARAHSVLAASTDTDLFGRYLGLQAAFRAAAAAPLGFGLGSTSAERFGVGAVAWTGDSQITTFLAELGWPGLLCFFAILLMVLRWSLKAIDATAAPDLRALLVGIASVQVGLIVTSLTGGPLWYAQPTCVYGWLLAGIAMNIVEGPGISPPRPASKRAGAPPVGVSPPRPAGECGGAPPPGVSEITANLRCPSGAVAPWKGAGWVAGGENPGVGGAAPNGGETPEVGGAAPNGSVTPGTQEARAGNTPIRPVGAGE